MDPLLYNNCVLTHNIAMLSNLPIQQLVVERDKIKKEFEDYKIEHNIEDLYKVINVQQNTINKLTLEV